MEMLPSMSLTSYKKQHITYTTAKYRRSCVSHTGVPGSNIHWKDMHFLS